ncbi:MAG: PAS domain-containing protein, partial [Chloroflexota bacterium]|nr:PAS domain-containing protein [Chloroflexota bacterium]
MSPIRAHLTQASERVATAATTGDTILTDQQPASRLVVIGSSAGGIDALARLVTTLPTDFPAPIVVAQHLDPHRVSHLGEILANRSTLPVRVVDDHEHLEPGVVYVVPSNRHVEVTDHEVRLRAPDQALSKPSIDLLLSSAAESYRDGLIAVILTGTGADGADGAWHVKALGGTVIIQNPDTAAFPAMPLALAPSTVDIVTGLDAIGPLLHDLLTGAFVIPPFDDDDQFRAVLGQLRDRSGIDFSAYKTPTIRRRLQHRMAATGARDFAAYVQRLQRDPGEYQRLANSFLIKVTEFFRDSDLFAHVRERILPAVIADARERGELRLWSAGCATGEEAYSLAIILTEVLDGDIGRMTIRVFATDIDHDAIAFARRGVYPRTALANLSPEQIERHFLRREDGTYEVNKQLRSLVVFGQHDLGQRAPFPRIDLALCRNVLIYFTPDLQRRALQLFAFALRDGGYLALGKAETATPLATSFTLENPRLKVYRRAGDRVMFPPPRLSPHGTLSRRAAPFPARANAMDSTGRDGPEPAERARPSAERSEALLAHLPLGVVLVGPSYDIQLINPAARYLLGIHTPAIGDDLIHTLQGDLLAPVRGVIDTVIRTGEPATVRAIATDTVTGENRPVEIACHPEGTGPAVRTAPGVMLVVSDGSRAADAATERTARDETIDRLTQQVGRLTGANRQLLDANRELTAANTDLLNANEELMVSTEEVQAATEEVETLNEELQATNEELETLNEELQATNEELSTTNEDLENRRVELRELAGSLERQRRTLEIERRRLGEIVAKAPSMMVVMSGPAHLVELANVGASRRAVAAGDRPGDSIVGRTAREAISPVANPRFFELLDQVYATGEPFVGQKFSFWIDQDGEGGIEERYLDISLVPLPDVRGGVEGILCHSVDVTDQVSAREAQDRLIAQLTDEGDRLNAILTEMADAVIVVTADGTPVLTNPAYDRTFDGTLDLSGEDGQPLLSDQTFWTRAARGEAFDIAFSGSGPDGRRRWFEATGRPVARDDTLRWGVIVIRDITDRSIRRLQDEFLAVAGHELRTPLTAAQGAIQLVIRRLGRIEDDGGARRYTDLALQQVRRMTILIDDLLDVARLQSGRLQIRRGTVDLSALVERIAPTAQLLTANQTIEMELPPAPVVIAGDANRLEQVLLNLLTNAINHAPSSERIVICLAESALSGEWVHLQVRDFGAGIAPDHLDRIFTRFTQVRTADDYHRGLGLGLFIAREIVTAHGGSISVASTVG